MKILKTIGAVFLVLLLVLGGLFYLGLQQPLTPPQPVPVSTGILLMNARMVDLDSGRVRTGMDFHIDQGRIVQMGRSLSPVGMTIVDADGRFAMPGLIDMHVHSLQLAPVLTHPMHIAAGVTAVRDMGGCLGEPDSWVACASDKRRWNEAVAAGRMVGPRYDQVTSLAINGGSEIPSGQDVALGAATEAGARKRAAFDAGRGIDFLKPYSMLPREGYFALAEAAREHGLYLAGHKPLRVSAEEALRARQRSFEHAFLFIWECFPGAAALRESEDMRSVYTDATRRQMLEQHDEVMCRQLMRRFASAGAVYVPTHTTRKMDAYAADAAFRDDERLRYIPGPLRFLWNSDADSMVQRTDASGLESYRQFYEFGLKQSARAHWAGVTVLAGTDSPDSFVFPGLSLHDELGHLVEAGLTPREALRAATVEPARALGLKGRAGVLAPGARADILLLTKNPLEDIQHLSSLDTVILAGQVYDRQKLDELLQGVEDTAGHWSMWPRFIWDAIRSPIFRAQAAD